MVNPLTALPQMKLLINLAQIDGSVADREKNFIINIGRANGIYPDEITPLFDQKHELIVPDNLSVDDKFNYIFSLIQLMKIDERMYKEEIVFCHTIAGKLGYNKEVMFDLLFNVNPGGMTVNEVSQLKKMTEKYLKK
jgi:hypothetical protein